MPDCAFVGRSCDWAGNEGAGGGPGTSLAPAVAFATRPGRPAAPGGWSATRSRSRRSAVTTARS
eukprot:15460131-Alexandrium_andersonii.AAC.1